MSNGKASSATTTIIVALETMAQELSCFVIYPVVGALRRRKHLLVAGLGVMSISAPLLIILVPIFRGRWFDYAGVMPWHRQGGHIG